jgi:TatD DNase family protein
MWIDIGVNLTNSRFAADREAVISRAQAAGVAAMIVTGTTLDASLEAEELTKAHDGYLYSTAGVHPHDARTMTDSTITELGTLSGIASVRAIGECGLDYNRDYSPRDSQASCFEAQLALAVEKQLPVFMHQRDAHDDFMAILRPYRDGIVDGVVHCFTGEKHELHDYLDLDLHIGLTGWICDERRGLELRKLAEEIPSNRLMLETDAPYLVPRDLRPRPKGGRNEPCFLPHIAQAVAHCRSEHEPELSMKVLETTRRFFRLPPSTSS